MRIVGMAVLGLLFGMFLMLTLHISGVWSLSTGSELVCLLGGVALGVGLALRPRTAKPASSSPAAD